MQTSADFAREKQELQTILDSGIFHRAPNLAQLLTYVCAKFFEGTAEQLKEYNIAVDALGRPADFDQKRDSIVRVEAHRLRKRLREYYDADGADHMLRIDIPPGQYAPKFVRRESLATSLSAETLVSQEEVSPDEVSQEEVSREVVSQEEVSREDRNPEVLAPIPPPVRGSRSVMIPVLVLLVFCTGALALWKRPIGKSSKAGGSAIVNSPAVKTGSQEVRILAGHAGSDYTDRLGRIWQADRYFQGGSTFETLDHPIAGTREPRIYQSRREGAFTYDIPLGPGVYELRLHFAETLYGENNVAGGGESSRVFNVHINGKEVLHEFDVISEAGPSTADVRAFKDISPAADGKLHLKFEPFTNPPQLSAIEITPGTPGRLRPIRMIALDRAYTDTHGSVWEPDRYARGGQLVLRTKQVEGSGDPELFRGERFGNLRYVIPVPAGRYGVTLHFAEAWFGPGTPPGGGVGSRVFDILSNGVVLRHGFDIFKEAQGGGRATTFTVHGLEPDGQGKINIALTPSRNYACINALEVVDESK
jgi:Malectin domain